MKNLRFVGLGIAAATLAVAAAAPSGAARHIAVVASCSKLVRRLSGGLGEPGRTHRASAGCDRCAHVLAPGPLVAGTGGDASPMLTPQGWVRAARRREITSSCSSKAPASR